MPERLRLREALGITPIGLRLTQARLGLVGDPNLPKARFDASSLRLLMPRVSIPMWLGRQPVPRKVVFTNLFNHRPTPIEEGWSVRRRSVLDFRGKTLTYDSHNGTDLAMPPGTVVVAPAPARIVRVSSEFHRGGLKVVLDHGQGLLTSYSHLGRVERREGEVLARGERFALSGMSGLDGLTMFPWLAPHIHFNVWLGARYVDPFGGDGQARLWRTEAPRPAAPDGIAAEDSDWDPEAIERTIEGCLDGPTQRALRSLSPGPIRAGHTFFESAYFPTRFPLRPALVRRVREAGPVLDLPVRPEDFDGAVFVDAV